MVYQIYPDQFYIQRYLTYRQYFTNIKMKIKFLIFDLQKLNHKVNETQTMSSGFSCNGAQVFEVTAFWLDTHIVTFLSG